MSDDRANTLTEQESPGDLPMHRALEYHPRSWRGSVYVYPVISRRSQGLSIGVNLNVDKACNFDCIYCQVDRSTPSVHHEIELGRLKEELDGMLDLALSGAIWTDPAFESVEPSWQLVDNIAISGDGEPTMCPKFEEAIRIVTACRHSHAAGLRIVLMSNATLFHRPSVRRGLDLLNADLDEVWAKLDAGTEAVYRWVDRTKVSLDNVLRNILELGRQRPVVIQSMLVRTEARPFQDADLDTLADRILELKSAGCRIKCVQLYTTARAPACKEVLPLENEQLVHLAQRLRHRVPSCEIEETFGIR